MRSAIKKGKIGVWYYSQIMEEYKRYMSATTDEERSMAGQRLNTLGRMIIPNSEKFQSDWKGAPDVALFSYGFYNPAISLMLKFKEPVAFIGLDFDPSIVKDHPIMIVPSGGFYGLENSEILRAKFDGYFISYPSNSTILLRRTANGQPAMLMYEYGNGRVIVSSLFSDWGYTHSQATQDEIKIVRDMVSWTKKPDQLPEIKQGETVSVSVSVTNNVDIDATSVKYFIYNPDRTTVVDEQLLAHNISVGKSAIIPISYTIPQNSALGVYHIDYELFNPECNIIQPRAETDS